MTSSRHYVHVLNNGNTLQVIHFDSIIVSKGVSNHRKSSFLSKHRFSRIFQSIQQYLSKLYSVHNKESNKLILFLE